MYPQNGFILDMYASHIQFFFRNGFFKKFKKFELDIVNTLCLLQKTEKSTYTFTKVQKNYFIFFFWFSYTYLIVC